jgi:hypothetical protein
VIPTLIDTKTGARKLCTSWQPEASVFWWTEGNGSCDCNRALAFGGDEMLEQQILELSLPENVCIGCHRWYIIEVSGDLEGYSEAETLERANPDYTPILYSDPPG